MRSAALAAFGLAGVACAQCVPTFTPGYFGLDLNGQTSSLVVFDDGTGSMLYAAGGFTRAGGVSASHVARWDGQTWSAMGAGLGNPGFVFSQTASLAAVDPDGSGPETRSLFAFGSPFNRQVHRWTGSAWVQVGVLPTQQNTTGPVVLETFDPDGPGPGLGTMYVGIDASPGLLAWTGAAWTPLPNFGSSSVNPGVFTLVVHDEDGAGGLPPALYVGGRFTDAGGAATLNIGRWDGSTWSPLGLGSAGAVSSIASFDEDGAGPSPARLFALGTFFGPQGQPLLPIARWNGATWSSVAGGLPSGALSIRALDEDGPGPGFQRLFAVGGSLHVRESNTWTFVVAPASRTSGVTADVRGLAAFDDDGTGPQPTRLFIAGQMGLIDAVPVNNIARRGDTSWEPLQTGAGLDGPVRAMCVFDEDGSGPMAAQLFAGGGFVLAGDIIAAGVARWTPDGSGAGKWTRVGSGLSAFATPRTDVSALLAFDADGPGPAREALYAGGNIVLTGGSAAVPVAKWDGSEWSPVGTPASAAMWIVRSLCVFDPDGTGPLPPALHLGGYSNAGPIAARLDHATQQWVPVGTAYPAACRVLSTFDEDGAGPLPPTLYAGVEFDAFGPGGLLALVDGVWTPVGGGVGGPYTSVRGMIEYDFGGPSPELVVVGDFWCLGGSLMNCTGITSSTVGRWRGQSGGWASLAGGLYAGQGSPGSGAYAVGKFRDEIGESIYVSGALGDAGGIGGANLFRWSPGSGGGSWSAVGAGLDGNFPRSAYAMLAFDDDGSGPLPPAFYLGGEFTSAGGLGALNFARWACSPCYANCDGSTAAPILNVNDFTCFLNKFAAGDPTANCDGSTSAPTLNVNDFTCFLNAFAAGCR
ncbi:MAG: GC-type dockerin domain-anchored protein [Phycisphaerales bacterium]